MHQPEWRSSQAILVWRGSSLQRRGSTTSSRLSWWERRWVTELLRGGWGQWACKAERRVSYSEEASVGCGVELGTSEGVWLNSNVAGSEWATEVASCDRVMWWFMSVVVSKWVSEWASEWEGEWASRGREWVSQWGGEWEICGVLWVSYVVSCEWVMWWVVSELYECGGEQVLRGRVSEVRREDEWWGIVSQWLRQGESLVS